MMIEPRYTEKDREKVRQYCLENPTSLHQKTATACDVHKRYAYKVRRELVAEGKLTALRTSSETDPSKPYSRAHRRMQVGQRELNLKMSERDQLRTAKIRIEYLEDQVADLDRANKELAAKLVIADSLLAGMRS